jgi:hypothetical protein
MFFQQFETGFRQDQGTSALSRFQIVQHLDQGKPSAIGSGRCSRLRWLVDCGSVKRLVCARNLRGARA